VPLTNLTYFNTLSAFCITFGVPLDVSTSTVPATSTSCFSFIFTITCSILSFNIFVCPGFVFVSVMIKSVTSLSPTSTPKGSDFDAPDVIVTLFEPADIESSAPLNSFKSSSLSALELYSVLFKST